ncbi:MAG TPA: XRE family transcriptional regulator [Acidimicrobiales bacterium]
MSDDVSTLQNTPADATAGGAASVVSLVADNVRRLRSRAGLSLRELATRAGVSTSTLSNLEAGVGNPGVETLVNIAGALGVPFSELVLPHEPDVQVQRADEGVVVQAAGAPFSSRLLMTTAGRSTTEVYEATLAPGSVYQAGPHLTGVSESVIVVAGRLRVGPTDAVVELHPGDRATFAADQPHSYEALDEGTRAILVISYR